MVKYSPVCARLGLENYLVHLSVTITHMCITLLWGEVFGQDPWSQIPKACLVPLGTWKHLKINA